MAFTKKLIIGFISLIFLVLVYLSFIQKTSEITYKEKQFTNRLDSSDTDKSNQRQLSDKVVAGLRKITNRVNNYINTKEIDKEKLTRYVKDEMKFENIKHINVAIASELEDLRKRGMPIGDLSDLNQEQDLGEGKTDSEQVEVNPLISKEDTESVQENIEQGNDENQNIKFEHEKEKEHEKELMKEEQVEESQIKPEQEGQITPEKGSQIKPEQESQVKPVKFGHEKEKEHEKQLIKEEQVKESQVNPEQKLQKFKFRNPDESELGKLSKEQYNLEKDTDPLKESASCSSEVYLIVLVISQPENEDRRNSIRDSWGMSYADDVSYLKNGPKPFQGNQQFSLHNVVKTVFIVGQSKAGSSVMNKVKEEARFKKDIVFGNLLEDYRNLTLKTRLGLKWAYYECQSTYIVKTDDDVFVNPVMLVEWLKGMPVEKLYTGWCNFNSPVIRDKRNKWYVSYEDFKGKVYPGYCLGGGYLISDDVLGAFLKLSHGRKLFPMEDLYVGLLIKELGDVKVNDQKKHFNLVYGGSTPLCGMNNLFLAHQVFGKNQVTHIKSAREALHKC